MFDNTYERPLKELQSSLKLPGLSNRVRDEFCKLAVIEEEERVSRYVGLLIHACLDRRPLESTCSLCLMRARPNILSCGHGLCDVCVRSEAEPKRTCEYTVTCPFCLKYDQLHLKPPTGSVRALVLSRELNLTLILLKRLRDGIFGDIRDYFDLVIGAEKGKRHAQMPRNEANIRP